MEKYLLIILIPLSLAGCSPTGSHWRVLRGNYEFINGRYQAAVVSYLGVVEEHNRHSGVVRYNLGNVFYALGETAAAEEEWSKALEGEEAELRFRTLFNQGNLYYELSRYTSAYNSFRQALIINPDNTDAKKNLELSLLKLSSPDVERETGQSEGDAREGSSSDEVDRILNYIRRKEESQWVSQERKEQESDAPFW